VTSISRENGTIAAMKTLSLVTPGIFMALLGNTAVVQERVADWAEEAISPDQTVAQKAQDRLRRTGPQGLEALQQRFAEEISAHRNGAPSGERWKRIGAALDWVGAQYYRWAGANAMLALFLNGVLLIAALACFGAVLTLPGIAGVVLTIGMAVDSNVLIFERIREELRAGKSAVAALAAGFSKAFATLVDTHVTTVVSCAFLFFFGTPAVKGFAATLVIGLITNLFTSVFVSRVAFDWELSKRRRTAELSIGMAR